MAGREVEGDEPGLCRAGMELLPPELCDSERFLSGDKLSPLPQALRNCPFSCYQMNMNGVTNEQH